MSTNYIYGLTDPRTGSVRYIGKSIDPVVRFRNHIWAARSGYEDTHKARWIRKLLDEGQIPGIVVLADTVDGWQELERSYIAQRRSKLTNTSAGGDGVDAPRTEEWKRKIGEAHRGKEVSQETRQKLREAQLAKRTDCCKKGHLWTEENTSIQQKEVLSIAFAGSAGQSSPVNAG